MQQGQSTAGRNFISRLLNQCMEELSTDYRRWEVGQKYGRNLPFSALPSCRIRRRKDIRQIVVTTDIATVLK